VARPEPARQTIAIFGPRGVWIAAAVAVVVLFTFAILTIQSRRWEPLATPAPAVTRFTVDAPAGSPARLSLSPDGRKLAFVSGQRIYVREFNSLESRAVDGTDGAGTPFWSPDGRFLAFVSGGKLRKIDLSGGPPITLCDVNTNVSGSWGHDGTILIGVVGDGIFRVPEKGGALTRVTTVDPARGQTRHMLPQFLPGDRKFLYLAGSNRVESTMLFAAALDSGASVPIMSVTSYATFVPERPGDSQGWLVFARDRTLMGRPFDARALRPTGDAVPLAGPAGARVAMGASAVEIVDFSAAGGTLAYRSAEANPQMVARMAEMGLAKERIGSVMDMGKITVIQNWMTAAKR
jgi:hypothetical protein